MENKTQPAINWVVETKLTPPNSHTRLLPRTALTRRVLSAVREHSLTIISAPAGYGKTTLLTTVVQSWGKASTAWLALDESDNDPARFFLNLLAAIEHAVPGSVEATQSLAASFSNPVPELGRLVGILANDLMQSGPELLAIVLDDLHAVSEPIVLSTIEQLIQYRPPAIRIVLSTRHKPSIPLARLRGRGEVADFHAQDLRFSEEDIETLFNRQLNIELSVQEILLLKKLTEGWPAGLRIFGAAFERIPSDKDKADFIQQTLAKDRFVFDFFAEEVLNQQGPVIRTFLLETSILKELNPSICRAITGLEQAQKILEDLHHQNQFVSVFADQDPSGGIYRHHPLFGNFLKNRLAAEYSEDEQRALHVKAAASLRDEDAIPHLLAAEMWPQAAEKLLAAGTQMVRAGLFESLRLWIEALPETLVSSRPYLLYMLGLCAFQQGNFSKARTLAERAVQGFDQAGDRVGKGEAILLLGGIASGFHEIEKGGELLEQALGYPISPYSRIMALINHAWVGAYSNDWDLVERDVKSALQIVYQLEELGAFNVLAPHFTVMLIFMPDGPSVLRTYCDQVIQAYGSGIGPVQVGAYSILGTIQLLNGRVGEAFSALKRAHDLSLMLGGFVWLDIGIDFGLLNYYLSERDYASFEAHWQERLPTYEKAGGAQEYLTSYLYQQGRAFWLQERVSEARAIQQRMLAVAEQQDLPESRLCRLLMQALIEIVDRKYAGAEKTLLEASRLQHRARHTLLFGNAQVLLAHLYLQWNRPEEAMLVFNPLLSDLARSQMLGVLLGEGEGFIPLLRRAADQGEEEASAKWLLSMLDKEKKIHTVTIPATGESLTPRESEVLLLLAEGLANREIAGHLVVSETTVKSHVTAILRKLNVRSRTQAVASARAIGLIG